MGDNEILFELIKSQSEKIDAIKDEMHEVRLEVAGLRQKFPDSQAKDKLQVGAAGGGIGAVIVGVVLAIFEHFKT